MHFEKVRLSNTLSDFHRHSNSFTRVTQSVLLLLKNALKTNDKIHHDNFLQDFLKTLYINMIMYIR